VFGILAGASIFLFDLGYRFPETKLDKDSLEEYDPFHIGALFAAYASITIGLFGSVFSILPNNQNILWPNIFLAVLGLICLLIALLFLYSKLFNQFILRNIPKHWISRYWPNRIIKTHFSIAFTCFVILIFDLIQLL
jgi:uncharacterized membrane-anchored protein